MLGVQHLARAALFQTNVGFVKPTARRFGVSAVVKLKSNLPFKWVRPEKIPCTHPKVSGDLEPVMELNLEETPPLEFQNSEELKTADEAVKRLFTLQFFPHHRTRDLLKAKYLEKVKRHALDAKSHEARIAKMTARIRDLQQSFEKYPRSKIVKVRLKEAIDKRKRLLLELREHDYKCFEFVLEKLNLVFKPQPPPDEYLRVERKRSLRHLCDQHCGNIVQSKLADYRHQLDSRKESFLENKLNTLKWIIQTEQECGVPSTVSSADVEAVERQLEDLRKAKAEAEKAEKLSS